MVVTAQGSKSPIQALADKIASYFVPAVTSLAIGTYLFWYFSEGKTQNFAISTAITVLVIACPCALGLATPVALLVASGRGALRGVVIRHPRVLEATRHIDVAVFDKTGTLTDGQMVLTEFLAPVSAQKPLGASYQPLLTEKNILSLAMALESQNDHPVAHAITRHAISRSAEKLAVTEMQMTPGAGVAGRVSAYGKNAVIIIGSPESVAHSTTAVDPALLAAIAVAKRDAKSASLMAIDGVAIALFVVGDVIKSDAPATIAALRKRGITPWLLTGDHNDAAIAVAQSVGIAAENIISKALPEEKIEKVRQLQSEGLRVLMVGDGINDAAALAQADLSMAMGTGTDTAIATADITLMRPELMSIVDALDLSRKTLKTIRVNLGWAFAYNTVGIPIAAMGLMSPMYAAGAMALSSLFVVTNSLRIR
jgi:Cu+-exporting ATPase